MARGCTAAADDVGVGVKEWGVVPVRGVATGLGRSWRGRRCVDLSWVFCRILFFVKFFVGILAPRDFFCRFHSLEREREAMTLRKRHEKETEGKKEGVAQL